MSEEQYNKLVTMIGQMAEQITSNLTAKIETEVGGLRQEMHDGFAKVNQRIDDLTQYVNQRNEIIERRQFITEQRIEMVEMEIRSSRASLAP